MSSTSSDLPRDVGTGAGTRPAHGTGPAAPAGPAAATGRAEAPAELLVRRLEVDLRRGFGRHWHGGDRFRSQFFNALSMSFPVGEQFFIDSVKAAAALLPDGPQADALRTVVAGFVGQEATHRRIHGLYNEELGRQGLANGWEPRALARLARLRAVQPPLHPLHALAATCALEHLTALLADGTLRHRRWLDGAEPVMQAVWGWHSAEETEHCAVAFDLFTALGGSRAMRLRWYALTLAHFTVDATRQTLANLRADGSLWRLRTWSEGLRLLAGRDGLLWRCTGPLLDYLRADFHPLQDRRRVTAQQLARDWLERHAALWRPVGRGRTPAAAAAAG